MTRFVKCTYHLLQLLLKERKIHISFDNFNFIGIENCLAISLFSSFPVNILTRFLFVKA